MRDSLTRMLIAEEGYRLYAYDDETGQVVTAPAGKLSIGVGRNLQDKPLSDAAIKFLLAEDIDEAWNGALIIFPDLPTWKNARQMAVIGMVFQLGQLGFLKFKKTIKAIHLKDWDEAAEEALDSKWAKEDSPSRAYRMSEMLRTGEHGYG